MNKKELFSVGLRFLALLLFLNCFGNIIQFVLRLTIPVSKLSSPFGFSAYGNLIQIIAIFIYGGVGYFFLMRPDKIAQKFINENKKGDISREMILQIAIAYQGVVGVIYSMINLVIIILNLLPILDIENPSSTLNLTILKTGSCFIELVVGILLLRYYEKIARFFCHKIPQKFWA